MIQILSYRGLQVWDPLLEAGLEVISVVKDLDAVTRADMNKAVKAPMAMP